MQSLQLKKEDSETNMPSDWNPETYRRRAKKWPSKAVAVPFGDERKACEVLAQGYARLAQLIEQARQYGRLPSIDASRVSEDLTQI